MLFGLWRDRKDRENQQYVLGALAYLIWKVDEMTVSLQEIRDQIAADKNVVSSAVTLLGALKARLDSVTSNTDLQVLKDDLGSMIQPLSDAIAQNTPASGDTSSSGSTGSAPAGSTSTGSTPPSDATPGTPAPSNTPPASSADAPPPSTGTTPSPTGS